MKSIKNTLFYVLTIGGLSGIIYIIISYGANLEIGKVSTKVVENSVSQWHQFKDTYFHNITHPLSILLLQIITIILVARLLGFLCKKIGQPSVIGEIIAGILLGPSFIGMYFPEFSEFLFPKQSLGNLQFLSQIGLILFMFVVGMELDLKVLKTKAHEAIVISHASIIFPFTLGIGLAYFVYQNYAPAEVTFLPFSLFIGISMSITAFPVLARIVQERGISKTKIGSLVITCAAADDITAWCMLAAVIAIVKAGSFVSSIYTILMAIGYVLLMVKLVKPFLKRMGDIYSNKEGLSKPVVAVFFIILLVSAYATEVIGIHALFGAFLAGVIMPSSPNFRNIFIEKIEDVSMLLLLPLFFVFTGLRTQIGLLNEPHLWVLCSIVILVAVIGKFIGSAIAAKFIGQTWRDSLIIGALMNTRGLMELIVLNIGYDLGVLTPEVFAIMVIMALVTTFMTGPALNLINHFLPEPKDHSLSDTIEKISKYNILVSFGSPLRGKILIRLANSFIKKAPENAHITALHLSPSSDINQFNAAEYERESFKPIKREALKLNMTVESVFKSTQDIDKEISETANADNVDLLLVGIGRSVYEGSVLGKILGFTSKMINPEKIFDKITGKEKLFDNNIFDERTKHIIKSTKVPVGILLDNGLEKIDTVFMPIFSISDSFLLIYAQKIIHNSNVKIVIFDAIGIIKQNPELKNSIRAIEKATPNNIALFDEGLIEKDLLLKQDIVFVSIDGWKKMINEQDHLFPFLPSVLIFKP